MVQLAHAAALLLAIASVKGATSPQELKSDLSILIHNDLLGMQSRALGPNHLTYE